MELSLLKRCDACQNQPGGPVHGLALEIRGLAAEVKSAFTSLAEQRGARRVWGRVATVTTALVGILLAAFLQYKFSQLRQLQEDVAAKLKATHAIEVQPEDKKKNGIASAEHAEPMPGRNWWWARARQGQSTSKATTQWPA
jgi:hypothetical protein